MSASPMATLEARLRERVRSHVHTSTSGGRARTTRRSSNSGSMKCTAQQQHALGATHSHPTAAPPQRHMHSCVLPQQQLLWRQSVSRSRGSKCGARTRVFARDVVLMQQKRTQHQQQQHWGTHSRPAVPPPTLSEGLVKTRFVAETLLPTKYGRFRLRGYQHTVDGGKSFTEPTAIICGDVEGREDIPVRVHDACYTSEVLGSLKCDCAQQLQLAMHMIQHDGPGMIIYLQQEGRGIGLANKIAAYALQEQGLDTVDANRALGLPDDCREYTSVRNILQDLKIKSIHLMTNNPRKMKQLDTLGITITGRIPVIVRPGKYNQEAQSCASCKFVLKPCPCRCHDYLQTKADRMDHVLTGDWCFWNHEGEPTRGTTLQEVLPLNSASGPDAPLNGVLSKPNVVDRSDGLLLENDGYLTD